MKLCFYNVIKLILVIFLVTLMKNMVSSIHISPTNNLGIILDDKAKIFDYL